MVLECNLSQSHCPFTPLKADNGPSLVDLLRQQGDRHRRDALCLVSAPDLLAHLVVVRIAIEPHRLYIADLFFYGGDKWEQAQRCREARALRGGAVGTKLRDYRLLVAAKCTLERSFMQSIELLMGGSDLYDLVPAHSRTLAVQTKLFSMLTYSASRMAEIIHQFNGFPFRVFKCLEDLGGFATLAAERDCLKDAWSKDFLSMACKPEKAADAQQTLRLLAIFGQLDTAPIECSHASVRRLLVHFSVQCPLMAMENLNAEWVGKQQRLKARLWGASQVEPSHPGQALPISTTPASTQRSGAALRQGGHKGRRLGPHRLFVSEYLRANPTKDFSAANAAYRALPEADRERLAERAANLGPPIDTAPVLGLRPYLQVRQAKRRRVERLAQEHAIADESLQSCQSRARAGLEGRLLISEPGVLGEGVLPEHLVAWGHVGKVAEHARVLSKAQRLAEKNALAELDAYIADTAHGAGQVMDSLAALPVLTDHEAELMPYPHEGATHQTLVWASSAFAQAARATSLTRKAPGISELLSTLSSSWADLNASVPHHAHPEADFDKGGCALCLDAGVCLCNDSGKKMHRFAKSLDAKFRPLFPPYTTNRGHLVNGQVVCLFLADQPSQEEHFVFDPAQHNGDAPSLQPDGGATCNLHVHWLHVARCSLSPWRATYHRMAAMSPLVASVADGRLEVPGLVRLSSSFAFETKYEALSKIDLSLRWHLVVFLLKSSSNLVGQLRPSEATVVVMGEGQLIEVWNPARRRHRQRVSQWSRMAAESIVGDGSSSNEDLDTPGDLGEDADQSQEDADDGSDASGSLNSGEYQSLAGLSGASSEGDLDSEASESGTDEQGDESATSSASDDHTSIRGVLRRAGAGASSSSVGAQEEPAVPPNPAMQGAMRRHGRPEDAELHVDLPGLGVVAFYDKQGGFVQATCKKHGCKLRRTCNAEAKLPRGRPLGLIGFWLQNQDNYADKASHMSSGVGADRLERILGRLWLKEQPGSSALFERERPRADGEDSEPERKP